MDNKTDGKTMTERAAANQGTPCCGVLAHTGWVHDDLCPNSPVYKERAAQQRTNPGADVKGDSLPDHPESESPIPSHVSARQARRRVAAGEAGEVERLRAQQNGWITRIRELEEYAITEGGKLRARIAELEGERDDLKNLADAQFEDRDRLYVKIGRLEAERDRLAGELIRSPESMSGRLTERISELTASLADREAEIAELKAGLLTTLDSANHHYDNVELLKCQVADRDANIERLMESVAAGEAEVKRLSRLYDTGVEARKRLIGRDVELETTIARLTAENAVIRKSNDYQGAKLNWWRDELEGIRVYITDALEKEPPPLYTDPGSPPAPPPLPEAKPFDTPSPEAQRDAYDYFLIQEAAAKGDSGLSAVAKSESDAPGETNAVAENRASVEGEKSAMEPRYSETNEAHLLAAGWRYVGGVNCWLDPQTQIEQTFEDAWQVQRRRDTSAQQAAPPEVPGPQQATTDEQNSPPAEPLNQEEIDRVKLMLANARAMFHNPERAAATGCEGCAEILELLARAAAAGQYQDGAWKIATSPQEAPESPATLSQAGQPAEQGGDPVRGIEGQHK